MKEPKPTGPGKCRLCPRWQGAETVCVSGSGPLQPEFVVIEQAPSVVSEIWCRQCHKPRIESCVERGHTIGQPGVGYECDKILHALHQSGIPPEHVYYTTVARCAGVNDPTLAQMMKCRPYLLQEMETLDWSKCRGVLLVGTPALRGITISGRLVADEVRFRTLDRLAPEQIKAPVRCTPNHDTVSEDLYDMLHAPARVSVLPSQWARTGEELSRTIQRDVIAIDLEWFRDGRIRLLGVCDGSATVMLKTPTPLWNWLNGIQTPERDRGRPP